MSRVPELDLAERARAGDPLTGALVRMPNEETVEMLAVAGFDFVLIDCEHGPADVVELRRHIASARMYDMETVVRVGQGEEALILRALDQGASGILAPHIDTAEQARALVAAVHYPPRGHRGFATYARAGGFGTVPAEDHRRRYAERTLVLAMPESPIAADHADAVMAVEGIDGYMIGVADLAAATGPNDRTPVESCALVHAAGQLHGRIRADIVGTKEAAVRARAEGCQVVVINLAAVMMDTFTELITD